MMQFLKNIKQLPGIRFQKNVFLQDCCSFRFSNRVQHLEQDDGQLREYFFFIDHKGLLYLDDQESKNFTNCLKDKRFMKFGEELDWKIAQLHTVCWGEFNYVRSSVKPIVFSHLDEEKDQLLYSLYLNEPFDPHLIRKDLQGLLYHQVSLNDLKYGIFSTEVLMRLSENIKFDGNKMLIDWKGEIIDIPDLPLEEVAIFK